MVIHRGDNGLTALFWNRNAGAHIFSDINSPIMRASYNGYYPSFPSWRREFDSHRPLTIKKGTWRARPLFIQTTVAYDYK